MGCYEQKKNSFCAWEYRYWMTGGERPCLLPKGFWQKDHFWEKGRPSIFLNCWRTIRFSIPRPNLHANGVKFTLLEQDKCAYFLLHWHTLTMHGCEIYWLRQAAPDFQYKDPLVEKFFMFSISIHHFRSRTKDVNKPFSIFIKYFWKVIHFLQASKNNDEEDRKRPDFSSLLLPI